MRRYVFNVCIKGRRLWETIICRKTEVLKLFVEWENRVTKGHGGPGIRFFDNITHYLEFSKKRKTQRWYIQEVSAFEKRLKPFFDNKLISEFTRRDVTRFIDWRVSQGVQPSTVNTDINTLSSFFSWCIKQDDDQGNPLYNGINPCTGQRLPERNQREIWLSGEQVIEIIERSRIDTILEIAVMLACFAGLRRGEITTLTWDDIDLTQRRIMLRAERTKSKRPRSVPIPDVLFHFLEHHDPRLKGETLSPETRIVPVAGERIGVLFGMMRKSLSFKDHLTVAKLRFHDLRHVYAQTLRNAGVALDDIQSFLGHQSVTTTESRYAQSGGFNGTEKVNRMGTIIDFDRILRGLES